MARCRHRPFFMWHLETYFTFSTPPSWSPSLITHYGSVILLSHTNGQFIPCSARWRESCRRLREEKEGWKIRLQDLQFRVHAVGSLEGPPLQQRGRLVHQRIQNFFWLSLHLFRFSVLNYMSPLTKLHNISKFGIMILVMHLQIHKLLSVLNTLSKTITLK